MKATRRNERGGESADTKTVVLLFNFGWSLVVACRVPRRLVPAVPCYSVPFYRTETSEGTIRNENTHGSKSRRTYYPFPPMLPRLRAFSVQFYKEKNAKGLCLAQTVASTGPVPMASLKVDLG